MYDQYEVDLAHRFMSRVVPDDNVWIEHQGPKGLPLAEACANEVKGIGGYPYIFDSGSEAINRSIVGLSPEEMTAYGVLQYERMTSMQAYIRIKDNADQAKVAFSEEQRTRYKTAMAPMLDYRIDHTRWLVVEAPTEELAADFGMTYTAFRDYYSRICLPDQGKMAEPARPLQKLMTDTDLIWIISPAHDTYLSFRKRGIPAVSCSGETNNPDGETFTAPIKDSINGTFVSGPTKYDGQSFQFVRLAFENGKIVYADAENEERTKKLNEMLDRDEGARYLGEYAESYNPEIQEPVGNIGVDEKIDGAIHIAKGGCYKSADNGNRSINHWDVVQIHRPEHGGGEIWYDGKLHRKDGRYVEPELLPLNPENLRIAMASETLAAIIPYSDSKRGGVAVTPTND